MDYKIGFGYDIHTLASKRELVLGGVKIPFSKGLKGHSDADVLLHAVCDAILGAMAQDDIGKHFPNSDDRYKGISSLILLRKVYNLLCKSGFKIVNTDITLVLQRPTISPYKEKMKKNISGVLKIKMNQVNIKATTNERIGDIGKGKAASCYCVVLIRRV